MNFPKKYLMAGVVLLLVGLVGCTAIDSSASEGSNSDAAQAADVDQIYALWDEYAAAWSAGDMDRWISLWIDDGIQMPPDEPRHIGIEQIRVANQPGLDAYDWDMTINPEEVRILGERAYTHGLYEFAGTPKEGGEILEGNGKFLTILEKQADGSWKIAIDCFNYSPSK